MHQVKKMQSLFAKISALAVISTVTLCGLRPMFGIASTPLRVPMRCHQHSHPAPAPSRDSHPCCVADNNPALPAYASPGIYYPSLPQTAIAAALTGSAAKPAVGLVSRSEAPPTISPLRI